MQTSEQNIDQPSPTAEQVAEISSESPDYFYALGKTFKNRGDLDQAIRCYLKAIELNPEFADAYNDLGNAYKFKGDLKSAIFYYQKACQINPQFAEVYYNLGILSKEHGRFQDAISCYRKTISLKPDFVEAHFNLGNTFRELGNLDEAIQSYRKALEINPEYAEAYNGIGTAFQELGKLEEASACYHKHMQIRADAGIEVKAALLLPVICESSQSIINHRKRISVGIDNLSRKDISLHDPFAQIGKTNFLLAYHGMNNKTLQKKIASFYLRACPELAWQQRSTRSRRSIGDIIKIGIISQYLTRHTIGHLNHGIVKYLDRNKFHVTVFGFPGQNDSLSSAITEAADETVILPTKLPQARQMVAKQSLDILFYPDIGMDPFTYFLAFSRLAPVQCTSWGHPDTTGIPNMDYYISSSAAEPLGAQGHYSEQLVLLNKFAMYCQRPQKPRKVLNRKDLGLPEDCHLYACVQSCFKIHPDFDHILEAILRNDPAAVIVFFDTKHSYWNRLLRKRFAHTLPDLHERIRFLRRLPDNEFLSFLPVPEVLLDTSHFSGGYTSLLAFACGAPIVTWPGEFMRSRLTYAFYKQMGITDCVADDLEAYVNIALRLANDKDKRREIRSKINTRAHVLFEDMDPIHELEQFFEWSCNSHHNSSKRLHP